MGDFKALEFSGLVDEPSGKERLTLLEAGVHRGFGIEGMSSSRQVLELGGWNKKNEDPVLLHENQTEAIWSYIRSFGYKNE